MKRKTKIKIPKLIGHRGVKNLCPENTIESISKAYDLGLNYVEVDVKITKDEIPILLHDDTIDRTTNGFGSPLNFNYNKLKKLDAGEYFYKKKTNIFIPKLDDVLNLCIKKKGNLNIELKPNKGFEKLNVQKTVELTKNIRSIDFFFSSFDLISTIEISKIYPSSSRSFLLDTFEKYSVDDLIDISNKYGLEICGLNIDIISNEIIRKIKKNNLLITVYSEMNINIDKAKQCFSDGIDSIFTDDPRELLKIC